MRPSSPASPARSGRGTRHAASAARALGLAVLMAAATGLAGETTRSPGAGDASATASRELDLDGVYVALRWPTSGEGTLEIVPRGLLRDNQPIQRTIDGVLHDATLADIDADGSPELYVMVDGPQGGQLLAWVANRRRSLSEAVVIGSDGEPGGRGRWRVAADGLHRQHATGDVPYRLRPGEATWRLEPADAPGSGD